MIQQPHPTFPCNADTKRPLVAGGFHAATDNEIQIAAWRAEHPGCIWGMPAGASTGCTVLDIDLGKPEKAESARAWLAAHRLPRTRTVRTRSGGLHVFFRHTPGIVCSSDRLALGVDIRNDGGYVIDWAGEGFPVLLDAPLAPMPDWLRIELMQHQFAEGDEPQSLTPPPSIDAVVNLLDALPNPASTTRDEWVKLCGAAAWCADQLDDPEERIKDAWCRWSDRWEGGAEEGSATKWDYEAARPHRAGWATLEYMGRRSGVLSVTRRDADEDFAAVLLDPVEFDLAAAEVARLNPVALTLPKGQPLECAREIVRRFYQHGGRATLRHYRDGFHLWEGTCHRECGHDEIRAHVWAILGAAVTLRATRGEDGEEGFDEVPFAPKARDVSDVLDAMRAVTRVPDHIDAPMWLDGVEGARASEVLPCANGLLHVESRELTPHTPAFFGLSSLQYAYTPDAREPAEWLKFLGSIWADEPDSIDALQEMFGLLLTPDTSHHKAWLIVGPPRSGKGTIQHVLTAMLGKQHVVNPDLDQLGEQFGAASLIGKPLALIPDARLDGRGRVQRIVGRLLSISGGDQQTIARKNRADWIGVLPTRFVVMSNELPRLTDTSGALASRLIVTQMTVSFLGREDHGLLGRIMQEMPGILNWALAGLARLRARGRLTQPKGGEAAMEDMADMASPIKMFLDERCEVSGAHEIACSALFAAWRAWCGDQHREAVGTAQTFGGMLRSAIPGVRRAGRGRGCRVRVYTGLRLRDDDGTEPGDLTELLNGEKS